MEREEPWGWQDLLCWKRQVGRLVGCESFSWVSVPNYRGGRASGRSGLAHLQPPRCPGSKPGAGARVLVASEWQEDFN